MPRTAALLITLAASPAFAQTMHWTWDVEVNGQLLGPSEPVVVVPGDEVLMTLKAEMDPAPFSFAGSIFAISVTSGDSRALFNEGTLDYSENNGYGRNPFLSALSPDNGTPYDTDSDGFTDTLDQIDTFQLPNFFCRCDDRSNPITVYSMLWTVGHYAFDQITLDRVPTSGGTYTGDAYTDIFGSSQPYDPVNHPLTINYFIPAPATVLSLAPFALVRQRR